MRARLPNGMTDTAVLFARTKLKGGCWEWQAGKTTDGYGHVRRRGKMRRAHRLAYETFIGPAGEGYVLHHCDNPSCCNPNHLYLGDHAQNMRDAMDRGRHDAFRQRAKTHCPSGHPYAGENVYVRPNGTRNCRACHRLRQRRYVEAKAQRCI